MGDPKDQHEHGDDLDLDPETVTDLDVEETDGDRVRGGYTGACGNQTNHCSTGCETN